MKLYTTILLFFVCSLFSQAKENIVDLTDSINDVTIENQQIISHKKVLGKVKKLKVQRSTARSDNYTYQIFERKGKLVAEFEMEVLSKQKKAQDGILSAQVKTFKDNVIHNGTNFIDFHVKSLRNDSEVVLQLDKVVKYLLAYKYL